MIGSAWLYVRCMVRWFRDDEGGVVPAGSFTHKTLSDLAGSIVEWRAREISELGLSVDRQPKIGAHSGDLLTVQTTWSRWSEDILLSAAMSDLVSDR